MKSVIYSIALGVALVVPTALFAAPVQIVVTSQADSASLKVGSEQSVTWNAQNFPEGATVNINLIKKVSDSPARYDLVRQIAQFSENDGQETWKVAKGDVGENMLVEVTCAGSTRFPDGCASGMSKGVVAVKSSFFNNIATAFFALFGFGE